MSHVSSSLPNDANDKHGPAMPASRGTSRLDAVPCDYRLGSKEKVRLNSTACSIYTVNYYRKRIHRTIFALYTLPVVVGIVAIRD